MGNRTTHIEQKKKRTRDVVYMYSVVSQSGEEYKCGKGHEGLKRARFRHASFGGRIKRTAICRNDVTFKFLKR